MRLFLLIFSLFICSNMFGQSDYTLQINDSIFDLTLEKEYQVIINDELVKIKVHAKDTVIYKDILYSFKHSKDFKVSKTNVDGFIDQVSIMTAEGTGIMVQQYNTLNPTMLNEIMISEVTKESLNYGFEMERENYSRKLISGQTINIDKAILSYRDEINIYEIASIGNKDEGLIILTMKMDDYTDSQGQKLIDLMWDTLTFK